MKNGFGLPSFFSRGIRRGSLFSLSFGIALLFLMATTASAQNTLTVTGTGSGCTSTGTATYNCATLSAAITKSNNESSGTGDTINFASTVTGTITLGSALPTIQRSVTIEGPGANVLAISGAGQYQIFHITAAPVTISGLTLANGSASTGGAIYDSFSPSPGSTTIDLTVSDCAFTGDSISGSSGSGGAIDAASAAYGGTGATLKVTNSTFADNTAWGDGGAIYDRIGTVTVVNSTFVHNGHHAPGYTPVSHGGAISVYLGTATVVGSTFVDNVSYSLGGAVFVAGPSNSTPALYVANSIFSDNSTSAGAFGSFGGGGGICFELGTIIAEDYNLFYHNRGNDFVANPGGSGWSVQTLGSNDVAGQDPKLLPLGYYGGPIETMMPEVGSAAIGVGADSSELPSGAPSTVTGLVTDQRGFPLNNLSGPVDIGAVQTNYLVVTSTSGGSAGGTCTSALTGSTCSLSDAIAAANGQSYADIGFSTSLGSGNPFTIAPSATLSLSQGNTVIVGPPDAVTISGGGSTQIFSMGQYSSANLTLYGLILTNGHKNSGNGGAIGHDGYGTVTISNCLIGGNSANDGGAIEVSENGALNVFDSTFFSNSSPSNGGAIYSSDGRVTVTNSTFDNNYLPRGDGGAIYNAGSSLTLTDDTFANNSANTNASGGEGGAIYNDSNRALTVTNTIFSDNSAASEGGIYDNYGSVTTGYDLFYNNTGGDSNSGTASTGTTSNTFPATGDNQESSSSPSPIAVASAPNGGLTPTVLTLPGPAICGGLLADVPGGTLTDQRGFPRTTTYTVNSNPLTCVDIGALQTHYTRIQFVSPPTSGYTETSGQDVDQPAPVVSVIENGRNTGGVPVTLTLTPAPSPSDVTGNTATTVADTGATLSNLNVTANVTTTYTLSSTLDLFTTPGGTTVSITTNPNATLAVTSPTVGTSTGLSFSPSSPVYGDAVTFTATVTPDSGTTVPKGTVSFTIDGGAAVDGTAEACPTGTASYSFCAYYSISSLDAGSHSVIASFTARTGFSNSNSTTANFTVEKATTKITFGPTPTPTYLGGNFTVSASTTNTDSSALTFSASGQCSLVSAATANPATLSSTGAGTCTVQASSVATTNFTSASATLDVTIAKATPTVSISNLPANALVGQSFTPDVVVSPSSDKGTVTVTLTGSDTGICTLAASGVVNFVGPTTSGGTGTCTLDVSVTGSTDFNAVVNQAVSFTVESDQIAIQTIANGVENLSLKNGQKNSLLKELDQAIKMINEGKINGAINNLNQFIAEVQDLASSGKLSQTLADRLIYDTNVIINALESQL